MKQSSHNQFIVFVMSCETVKPEVDYELVDYCDEVTEQIFQAQNLFIMTNINSSKPSNHISNSSSGTGNVSYFSIIGGCGENRHISHFSKEQMRLRSKYTPQKNRSEHSIKCTNR